MDNAAALPLKAADTAAENTKKSVRWGYKHNGFFALKVLLTLSGFIIAIIVNIAFPQKAAVEFKTYTLGIFGLNIDLTINDAYIFVIAVLMLIYGAAGLRAFFDRARRKLYCKNAAFRFAIGIALALWDIGGTKLQWFAQPFFPGPAQVIEAYLGKQKEG